MELGLKLGLGSVGLLVWLMLPWAWPGRGWRPGAEGARCRVRGLLSSLLAAEEEGSRAVVLEGLSEGGAAAAGFCFFLSFLWPSACIVCYLAPGPGTARLSHFTALQPAQLADHGSIRRDQRAALRSRIDCRASVTSSSRGQGSRMQQTGTAGSKR